MLAVKKVSPEVYVNPKSWFSEDSIRVLKNAWDYSDNRVEKYVKNVFDNMSGQDGAKRARFKDIDWKNVEWFEENKWNKYKWDNPKYENLQKVLTTKKGFVETLANVIQDKELTKKDKKQIFDIFETRLTNALGVNRSVDVEIGKNKLNAALHNILRDTYDMGKDVFTNKNVNIDAALKKLEELTE